MPQRRNRGAPVKIYVCIGDPHGSAEASQARGRIRIGGGGGGAAAARRRARAAAAAVRRGWLRL
jgi:hypothetical protein